MDKLMVIQHCGEVGGSGIGLLTVLEMLKNRFDIIIYCVTSPGELVKLYQEYGYSVKEVDSIPTYNYYSGGPGALDVGFLIPFVKLYQSKKIWTKLIKKEAPQFVLVNSMVLNWMWEPIKAVGAKSICHVREVLPNKWSLRAKQVLHNLEYFDAVWFISDYDNKNFRLKHPKIAIIRDCILQSPPIINHQDLDENAIFRVLYMGGLSKLKGIDVLLKAVDYIDQNIVINIAGNCETDMGSIADLGLVKKIFYAWTIHTKKKLIALFNVSIDKHKDRIYIKGHTNDVGELYIGCDVLVFPSRSPHQSRPAFEAGFYEKPVIISDFVETRESVKFGYNGLTFKPRNPKSLAEAINTLFLDRKLVSKLGKNNRSEALQRHTFDAVKLEIDRFLSTFIHQEND